MCPQKSPKLNIVNLALLYLSCFMLACAYGFIYLLPLVMASLGGTSLQVGGLLSLAGIATLVSVGYAGRMANQFGAINLCSIGALFCLIGFYIIYKSHLGLVLYSSGIFIGIGWSLYYAASPMIINNMVEDQERGKFLSNIAAFVVLGTGMGPLIGHWMISYISIQQLYLLPVIISSISFFLFSIQNFLYKKNRVLFSNPTIKRKTTLFDMLTTEARYPLMMVFMGACIFSSMMNFQTLYASSRGLNFSIYYACYMLSVVMSRFSFGGVLSRNNPLSSTPILLCIMFFGLLLLLLNHHSVLMYALSSIMLGVSYGLVYPLIKTYAVNITPSDSRADLLAYFTLFYFAGVYIFPLLAGFVINRYGQEVFLAILLIICMIDGLIGFTRSKMRTA